MYVLHSTAVIVDSPSVTAASTAVGKANGVLSYCCSETIFPHVCQPWLRVPETSRRKQRPLVRQFCKIQYTLGYGGGAVCGDQVTISCSVGEECTAALTTQGSTKVCFIAVYRHLLDVEYSMRSYGCCCCGPRFSCLVAVCAVAAFPLTAACLVAACPIAVQRYSVRPTFGPSNPSKYCMPQYCTMYCTM